MLKTKTTIGYALLFCIAVAYCGNEKEPECNFPKVDKELNTVYSSILTQYKNDTLFLNRLKDAQRIWIKFRDAHIEARFPTTKKGNQNLEYGSIYPQCACIELTELTQERIKQLQEWLHGTIEGDVCGGSYKTK